MRCGYHNTKWHCSSCLWFGFLCGVVWCGVVWRALVLPLFSHAVPLSTLDRLVSRWSVFLGVCVHDACVCMLSGQQCSRDNTFPRYFQFLFGDRVVMRPAEEHRVLAATFASTTLLIRVVSSASPVAVGSGRRAASRLRTNGNNGNNGTNGDGSAYAWGGGSGDASERVVLDGSGGGESRAASTSSTSATAPWASESIPRGAATQPAMATPRSAAAIRIQALARGHAVRHDVSTTLEAVHQHGTDTGHRRRRDRQRPASTSASRAGPHAVGTNPYNNTSSRSTRPTVQVAAPSPSSTRHHARARPSSAGGVPRRAHHVNDVASSSSPPPSMVSVRSGNVTVFAPNPMLHTQPTPPPDTDVWYDAEGGDMRRRRQPNHRPRPASAGAAVAAKRRHAFMSSYVGRRQSGGGEGGTVSPRVCVVVVGGGGGGGGGSGGGGGGGGGLRAANWLVSIHPSTHPPTHRYSDLSQLGGAGSWAKPDAAVDTRGLQVYLSSLITDAAVSPPPPSQQRRRGGAGFGGGTMAAAATGPGGSSGMEPGATRRRRPRYDIDGRRIRLTPAQKAALAERRRRRREARRLRRMHCAAVTIQSVVRGFLARRSVAWLRQHIAAFAASMATRIQAMWRARLARDVAARARVHKRRNDAATDVQCAFRSFRARRTVAGLRHEREVRRYYAALRIQCMARVAHANLYVALLFPSLVEL